MPCLSAVQMVALGYAVGWRGTNLVVGVSVAGAESGWCPEAANRNPPVEVSLGIWQVNLLAHPEVTESCAIHPGCSTRVADRLSGGGRNWSPWSAYWVVPPGRTTPRYRDYVPRVSAAYVSREWVRHLAWAAVQVGRRPEQVPPPAPPLELPAGAVLDESWPHLVRFLGTRWQRAAEALTAQEEALHAVSIPGGD